MKLKSGCFVFMVVICILFSTMAVSSSDNQTDVILNQNPFSDDCISVDNYDSNEKLEVTAHKSYDGFYEDIKNCKDSFNIENNYKYYESDEKLQRNLP